MTEEVLRDV